MFHIFLTKLLHFTDMDSGEKNILTKQCIKITKIINNKKIFQLMNIVSLENIIFFYVSTTRKRDFLTALENVNDYISLAFL